MHAIRSYVAEELRLAEQTRAALLLVAASSEGSPPLRPELQNLVTLNEVAEGLRVAR